MLVDLMADDRELDVGRALVRNFRLCDSSSGIANVDCGSLTVQDDLAGAMSGLGLCHLQIGVQDVGLSEGPSPHVGIGSVDRAKLTVAERMLDDFDVHEYVKRLVGSIPSIVSAVVRIDRPRRCGGGHRMTGLGKDRSAMLYTDGEIVYHEVTNVDYEHGKATLDAWCEDQKY